MSTPNRRPQEKLPGAVSFSAYVPAELQRFDRFGATQYQGQRRWGRAMTTSLKFRVEAVDEDVVVTLDGTTYMVRYCKADNQAGLKLLANCAPNVAPAPSTNSLSPGENGGMNQYWRITCPFGSAPVASPAHPRVPD